MAERLGAKVGDKIQMTIGEINLEYIIAALYDDADRKPYLDAVVFNDSPISKHLSFPYQAPFYSLAYLSFFNLDKGIEDLNKCYDEVFLHNKYGERLYELATEEELQERLKITYDTREVFMVD